MCARAGRHTLADGRLELQVVVRLEMFVIRLRVVDDSQQRLTVPQQSFSAPALGGSGGTGGWINHPCVPKLRDAGDGGGHSFSYCSSSWLIIDDE